MPAIQELIDSKGRPISRHDLYVAMGVNTIAASFGSAWIAMTYGMPLIMFMQAIGASGVIIGLVATVRLAALPAQIPAALASESLLSRKPLWSPLALVSRSLWFILAGLAFWYAPPQRWLPLALVGLIAASELLGNASAAPWLSWMADLIPLPIAGRFWGMRQSVATVASLAGLAAAGQILDATRDPITGQARPHGFAIVFAIAACVGVADIIVHHFVREPRPVPSPRGETLHRRVFAPFANRDFRLLTLSLGAWNFSLSMIGAFAPVYLRRDFGVTYSQLAALGIASALGTVVTGYGLGGIMDRIGARRLGAILFFAAPICLVPWLLVNHSALSAGPFAFPQCIALLSVAGILGGAIYSGVYVCQLRLAADLSPARRRTISMAVHWSLVGLLGALGPTAGGLMMDAFPGPARMGRLTIPSGLPFSFYHAQLVLFTALVWLVALPLLLAIRRPERPEQQAVATELI
jgi:MFS family permease